MKLIQHNLLFADGTIFLFHQPVLNTVTMMHMLALENGNVLALVDLIVAYAANLFGDGFLFVFGVLLFLDFI